MSTQIIPFDGGTLPAYLKTPNAAAVNADLMAHASAGFPAISIKGSKFTLVRDGERRVLMNPKDPDAPASYIDVVLIKVNKGTSKVFYAKSYTEGDDGKPDCFSNDGTVPDPGSTTPQSKSCATCANNVWGSKITEQGKKGKLCADSIRMAVAPVDALNDPMLLRVPAASMKFVGEYGSMLAKRGVPYNAVVTKISFDPESASPKLQFKPVGFLTEGAVREATDMIASDVVQNIIGAAGGFPDDERETAVPAATPASAPVAEPVKSKVVTNDEVTAAVDAAMEETGAVSPAPKARKPKPEVKPEAKPAAVEVDIDLDDLDFDA